MSLTIMELIVLLAKKIIYEGIIDSLKKVYIFFKTRILEGSLFEKMLILTTLAVISTFSIILLVTFLTQQKPSQNHIKNPISINGNYTTSIKDIFGKSKCVAFKITELSVHDTIINLNCRISIADPLDIKNVQGNYEMNKSIIFIVGYGVGKAERNQKGKVVLCFYCDGNKIEFTQN